MPATTIILLAALVLAVAGAAELERRRRSWHRFAGEILAERDASRRRVQVLERTAAALEAERDRESAELVRALGQVHELEAALAECDRDRHGIEGRELVVHTRRPDDQSVRGVCVGADRLELRLIGARYLSGSSESPLGGEVRIPRVHVAFVQDLGAAELEAELEGSGAH